MTSTDGATEITNTPTAPRRRGGKSRMARLLYVGLVDVWSGLIVVALLAMVLMRLSGTQLNVVQTASMTPNLPIDTLTMTRPVDADVIAVDDVIMFTNRDGEQVMHRVTEVLDHRGVRRFRTKGDANPRTDTQLVHEESVTGGLVGSVRNIGAVARSAQSPVGFVYLGLFLSPLIAWAARRRPQSIETGSAGLSATSNRSPVPSSQPAMASQSMAVAGAGDGVLCPSWLNTSRT